MSVSRPLKTSPTPRASLRSSGLFYEGEASSAEAGRKRKEGFMDDKERAERLSAAAVQVATDYAAGFK